MAHRGGGDELDSRSTFLGSPSARHPSVATDSFRFRQSLNGQQANLAQHTSNTHLLGSLYPKPAAGEPPLYPVGSAAGSAPRLPGVIARYGYHPSSAATYKALHGGIASTAASTTTTSTAASITTASASTASRTVTARALPAAGLVSRPTAAAPATASAAAVAAAYPATSAYLARSAEPAAGAEEEYDSELPSGAPVFLASPPPRASAAAAAAAAGPTSTLPPRSASGAAAQLQALNARAGQQQQQQQQQYKPFSHDAPLHSTAPSYLPSSAQAPLPLSAPRGEPAAHRPAFTAPPSSTSGASSRSSSVGSGVAGAGAGPLGSRAALAPASGPGTSTAGLQNLGNTCYMNSTLQCLAHIVPLSAFFASDSWAEQLVTPTSVRQKLVTSLARSYARLLRDLAAAPGRNVSPVELRRLAGSALSEEGMFSGSAQNDAHELLRFFLDALREALNRIRGRAVYRELKEDPRAPDAALAERYWRSYEERDSSVVGDIFRGQLRSVMTCGTCGYTSRSFEPFEELMLQIGRGAQAGRGGGGGGGGEEGWGGGGGVVRVEHLLHAFVQPESMAGEEAWRCDACKCPRESTKQIFIYKAPPVLILVLKRFVYTRLRRCKVDTPVCVAPAVPEAGLQLAPFMCPSGEDRGAAVYDLVGCVNHSGGTHGGHYTADCRVGGKNTWYNFNDSHAHAIGNVGRSGDARREPYVLFYERRR